MTTNTTSSLEQLVEIFRSEKGFERLFSLFLQKYKSYERLEKNITVTLDQPAEDEKLAIGGLFGKDYGKSKVIRVTAAQFEKALRKTKYGSALNAHSLLDLIEAYFGHPLVSKRMEKEAFLSERTQFFHAYKLKTESEIFLSLLDWIEREGNNHNRFYFLYQQDRALLSRILDLLIVVCETLPLEDYVYLPVFAAKLTQDPHAFDLDREEGKFFIYFLQILRHCEGDGSIRFDLNAEETMELLYEYNILRDDLSNYVTLFNVQGVLQNGEQSRLLKGACEDKAAFHLPLREVIKLKKVYAANEAENILYMIENAAVSAHVMNRAIKSGKRCSILTGNGQLRIAALRFLDLFVEHGGVIYYAGDFDPEGLGIAQKLLQRYGANVKLWKYGVEHYHRSLSQKTIEDYRLKQLDQIVHEDLQAVKTEMLNIAKSGYQENILDEIIEMDSCKFKVNSAYNIGRL